MAVRPRVTRAIEAGIGADQPFFLWYNVRMNKAFEIALKEIGTKEIVGTRHNPEVLKYYKKVGHSWVQDDETAWCAAFVGYCLEMAKITSTKKLNARSYMEWGEATTTPQIGDIVVLWRGTKDGWQGHVGFYIKQDKDGIWILGGNQSNQVCIIEYPKYRLLGYRKTEWGIESELKTPEVESLQKSNSFLRDFILKKFKIKI